MPLFVASSPFDSDVDRATSELNAKEDISLMREVCERAKQSPNAAKDCLRSIVKRINHKDPHVALQALTLLDVCAVYGGHVFRLEMATRDFAAECRTLISNGKTHTKVIRRLKHLIRKWAENEFKSDLALSIMPALYTSLHSEGHTFTIDETMTDIASVAEDDDLAKAIALSLEESGKQTKSLYPLVSNTMSTSSQQREPRKVRALYDFEAAEDNELTFKAGEILQILDDSDRNWWRGSSWRGEGLFPANFVTADLTAEIEPEIPKSRKSVHFNEEVEVQIVESPAVEVVEVSEEKIDEALQLIQNADPTSDVDAPELQTLEDQCRLMGPLIDQELESIDRHHNTLTEVNMKLSEAFQMYHSLMQGYASASASRQTDQVYAVTQPYASQAVQSQQMPYVTSTPAPYNPNFAFQQPAPASGFAAAAAADNSSVQQPQSNVPVSEAHPQFALYRPDVVHSTGSPHRVYHPSPAAAAAVDGASSNVVSMPSMQTFNSVAVPAPNLL